MTERAAPQYCPYCGEDSIRPWEAEEVENAPVKAHGDWRCESCLRVFVVRSKGLTGRG